MHILRFRQNCHKLIRSFWPNVGSFHKTGLNETGRHLVLADQKADLPAKLRGESPNHFVLFRSIQRFAVLPKALDLWSQVCRYPR